LNSVLALVDENGAEVESYEYDAWGRTAVLDADGNPLSESAIGNRYLFQGREYDSATGLYYFRARWYDPVSGRWLSKDPIGISGGLNLYAFCGNNPVNFTDPMGTAILSPGSEVWHEMSDGSLAGYDAEPVSVMAGMAVENTASGLAGALDYLGAATADENGKQDDWFGKTIEYLENQLQELSNFLREDIKGIINSWKSSDSDKSE
jgi:RHS repeat-associated protein